MGMSRVSLPPGFRFSPSDEELVLYYLKRKILGKPFLFDVIAEVDIYQFTPEELPVKSCLNTRDLEWYFFCPRDRKYSNGHRTNRSTCTGYWKTTGKDRPVRHDSCTVGKKKTLIFYNGRGAQSCRTDWVIHEYMLKDPRLAYDGVCQDNIVLCKLYRKSGLGPRNGEQHAPLFKEEEGEHYELEISSILLSQTSVEKQSMVDAVDQPVHPATGNMDTPMQEPDPPAAMFPNLQDPDDNMSMQFQDSIDRILYDTLVDDNGYLFLQDGTFEGQMFAPSPSDKMYNGLCESDRPAELLHRVSVLEDSGMASGISHTEFEDMLMSCDGEQHAFYTEVFAEARDSWLLVADNNLASLSPASSVHSAGFEDYYYQVTNGHFASRGAANLNQKVQDSDANLAGFNATPYR